MQELSKFYKDQIPMLRKRVNDIFIAVKQVQQQEEQATKSFQSYLQRYGSGQSGLGLNVWGP